MLEGRKVMVTGGSRGIGSACVKEICLRGGAVGFTYLSDDSSAMETRDIARSFGSECVLYRTDVRKPDELRSAFRDLAMRGGYGIDGVVVNAGIYKRRTIKELDRNGWDMTMRTNLEGAFNTVKAALEFMERGSIVMVSSQLAIKGSEHGPDYAAAKAGMLGLVRSLARELAPEIRVNAVAPGFVDTDLLSGDTPDKRAERISRVPLGRVASPEEIARPVVFLLSDMSSYITGATLDINGGLFIH